MKRATYYEHYKGGLYKLVAIAKNTETLEEKAIYVNPRGEWWERPLSMWEEDIEEGVPRFRPLHDTEGQRRFSMQQCLGYAVKKQPKK